MDTKQLTCKIKFVQLLRKVVLRAHSGFADGQYPIVDYVVNHQGCTQAELASALHITPASVAVSLPRMENAHLLCRRKDGANARCNRIYVTELGEQMYKQGRACADALDEKMYANLSNEQLEQLDETLDKIICNVTGEQTQLCPELFFRFKERLENSNKTRQN